MTSGITFSFFFFFFVLFCCFCCFCFSSSPFFPSLPPFIILASQNHQKKTLFSLRLRLHWYHFCQPCDPFLLIWRGLSLLHLHLLFIQLLFLCLPISLAEYWRIQLPSSSSSLFIIIMIIIIFICSNFDLIHRTLTK